MPDIPEDMVVDPEEPQTQPVDRVAKRKATECEEQEIGLVFVYALIEFLQLKTSSFLATTTNEGDQEKITNTKKIKLTSSDLPSRFSKKDSAFKRMVTGFRLPQFGDQHRLPETASSTSSLDDTRSVSPHVLEIEKFTRRFFQGEIHFRHTTWISTVCRFQVCCF